MPKDKIITSQDGSHTVYSSRYNTTYHSDHGALQESRHVFLKHGIHDLMARQDKKRIDVFEMGFGTGLNAILTYDFTIRNEVAVHYTTIDKYPLGKDIIDHLNYMSFLDSTYNRVFTGMHKTKTGEDQSFDNGCFKFVRYIDDFLTFNPDRQYDIIFYDAFDPNTQSELWTLECMHKAYQMLKSGGILTTYCAQGQFRRNLKQVGFSVLKLPGPPGKREITQAIKQPS